LLKREPEFGKIYYELGNLEFFTKSGDMSTVVEYYKRSEANGYSPPELQYRIGNAYYHLGDWGNSHERFFNVAMEVPFNRRLLSALGNVSFMRKDYYAAQGYFSRLLGMLQDDRSRFGRLTPNLNAEHADLAQRLLVAQNNLGVTYDDLARRTGNANYRTRALSLYSESSLIWDNLSRDPVTLLRPSVQSLSTPGVNLAYLNTQNALYPSVNTEPQIYMEIDKDVIEPSEWESLTE
jgi:tetratricopeptide (TPR) repeat protein